MHLKHDALIASELPGHGASARAANPEAACTLADEAFSAVQVPWHMGIWSTPESPNQTNIPVEITRDPNRCPIHGFAQLNNASRGSEREDSRYVVPMA